MVDATGIEPVTFRVSDGRSNLLSYASVVRVLLTAHIQELPPDRGELLKFARSSFADNQ